MISSEAIGRSSNFRMVQLSRMIRVEWFEWNSGFEMLNFDFQSHWPKAWMRQCWFSRRRQIQNAVRLEEMKLKAIV